MKTSVVGYPRVGALRELKFATEQYFKGALGATALQAVAAGLRKNHWEMQRDNGIDFIPSNDFSFYDNMLDTAVLINAVPKRYKDLHLDPFEEYFAMARGYQGPKGDVKALAMKKWFNTNYHYLVPELDDDTQIALVETQPFDEFLEAKAMGIQTKPVIVGAFTFLKLAHLPGQKDRAGFVADMAAAYSEILRKLDGLGAEWIAVDEPALVIDLTADDKDLFVRLYQEILAAKGNAKVLLQTYFGDIRDGYREVVSLPFDGIGLDFVEGKQTLPLLRKFGFPSDKILFAGVVNGKNIWRNDYDQTIRLLSGLGTNVVLGTSCSLLHVPYTVKNEQALPEAYTMHFAFAEEKLSELGELKHILSVSQPEEAGALVANRRLFNAPRNCSDPSVQTAVAALTRDDFIRHPAFPEREKLQKAALRLPLLPTTTIGSFPQTAEIKANRADYRKGNITRQQYVRFNKKKMAECIALQEKIGLDVLVHGEFERNDMVEYFGENLEGFVFTEKAWVQSYGTRCVKPPVIWGDISRPMPITVDDIVYAQSLTGHYMKGMLTGPVTILNWSFPREDISLKECAFQIALAIRAEVLDLEANGIKIIQIDEAALREKLPLRKSDWHAEYLDWAIPAFRLVHSGTRAETQIHTHMCYSEFGDIIRDIDDMDADVITFEASRSSLAIIDALNACGFQTQVGPGVYDIHSPRIPRVSEIKDTLAQILAKMPPEKLWVNPDCGLKTRENAETVPSLTNMVAAAKEIRERWQR